MVPRNSWRCLLLLLPSLMVPSAETVHCWIFIFLAMRESGSALPGSVPAYKGLCVNSRFSDSSTKWCTEIVFLGCRLSSSSVFTRYDELIENEVAVRRTAITPL